MGNQDSHMTTHIWIATTAEKTWCQIGWSSAYGDLQKMFNKNEPVLQRPLLKSDGQLVEWKHIVW